MKQRADTDRWSPEGERRSPSEDEGDEKTPSAAAEIYNAEDHQEIFHPKKVLRKCGSVSALALERGPAAVNQKANPGSTPSLTPFSLARTPPRMPEPFPAPPEDGES